MAVQFRFSFFEIPGFQSPSHSIADMRLVVAKPTDEMHHHDITTDQAHGIEQIFWDDNLLLRLDAPVSSATIFSCRLSKETKMRQKSAQFSFEPIKTFVKAELFIPRKWEGSHPIPATHSKSELAYGSRGRYPTTIHFKRY